MQEWFRFQSGGKQHIARTADVRMVEEHQSGVSIRFANGELRHTPSFDVDGFAAVVLDIQDDA